MRRFRSILLAVGLLAVPAAFASVSPAQGGEGKTADFHITKVVEGDGPTGGYVIEWFCEGNGKGGGGGVLEFDAAGPGAPETQTVTVTGPGVCSAEEIEANGADTVSYACDFVPGQIPQVPSSGWNESTEGDGPPGPGGCVDDRSADYFIPTDVATITVTNTFEADVPPDDPAPAPQADVVAASPGFTG